MGRYGITSKRGRAIAGAALGLALKLFACAAGAETAAAGGTEWGAEEYRLKAVFLERITRFIEWPEAAGLGHADVPFSLCVIGANPFGAQLETIYAAYRVHGKNVVLRYPSRAEDAESCHLLFISASESKNLPVILDHAAKGPTLTVADTAGFAERGVHINFYVTGQRLRFEVNETALRETPLRASYNLMQFARIVRAAGE